MPGADWAALPGRGLRSRSQCGVEDFASFEWLVKCLPGGITRLTMTHRQQFGKRPIKPSDKTGPVCTVY